MAKRTSDREENMTPYNRRLGHNATRGHVSDTSRLPKQPIANMDETSIGYVFARLMVAPELYRKWPDLLLHGSD